MKRRASLGVVVSYCKRGARDNPWMESFWTHFKGENASLFLGAAALEELSRQSVGKWATTTVNAGIRDLATGRPWSTL